ncbi:hypothetical protein QUA41_15795 [Microcoleus sp. Pol11C1]|uniref:hypothetical protein n=1 Tax=unclassified Microcoleus TaxID=2642155 RepID=UPI002FD1DCE7
MKAAKPKIGVLTPEAEGRRKEPEEVFLQIGDAPSSAVRATRLTKRHESSLEGVF